MCMLAGLTVGMFIIDHFEVHDAEGILVPADAEQVCLGIIMSQTWHGG